MFSLSGSLRYYFYTPATDMRKSFDGLCGLIEEEFQRAPVRDEVFIFVNSRRNRMKLLRWEPGGFVLYYKRLEEGTFRAVAGNKGKNCPISYPELVLLIEGVDVTGWSSRKRYSR